MFVLLVTYRVPLERIDELRPAHFAYLRRHYADGTFLVSGRQRQLNREQPLSQMGTRRRNS